MRFGRLRKWNREIAEKVEKLMSPNAVVGACARINDVAKVWLREGNPVSRELRFRHDGKDWLLIYDGPSIDPPEECDDPFLNCANIHFAFVCDRCKALRDQENPSPITPKHPLEGWDKALAEAARSEGWAAKYSAEGVVMLCPACHKD